MTLYSIRTIQSTNIKSHIARCCRASPPSTRGAEKLDTDCAIRAIMTVEGQRDQPTGLFRFHGAEVVPDHVVKLVLFGFKEI